MRGNCINVLTIGLFLIGLPASAQTAWYVDNALAGGANTGSSWSNAWRNLAAINWTSIRPGDTIYISGGSSSKTYSESWSVGASGTVSSPITIAVDGANPSHNGTVIFDYNSDGDTSTRVAINVSRNYITFDGNVNGQNRIQLNNLRNITNRMAPVGIYSPSSTGVVIDHLTFINNNNPIRFSNSTAITVRNSVFQKVRGDAAIALLGPSGGSTPWDTNRIYNNDIETLFNNAVPPGGAGPYTGPDGIQTISGTSIYGNIFRATTSSLYTSNQHPDTIQAQGNFLKVHSNEFINVGDSAFDYDTYANPDPHDVWIYNNLFRIVTPIDPYPEYFRLYTSAANISSITNFKILNNTFADNNDMRVIRFSLAGNPSASGNEIKNNIWYNSGGGTYNNDIYIDNSSNFTATSFSFDGNIYYNASSTPYIYFRGVNYSAPDWIASREPAGKVGAPQVVSYTRFGAGNDFHLRAGDTVAKDAGVSLASYFSTDKDGTTRPQGSGWDIGAFELRQSGAVPSCDLNQDSAINVVDVQMAVNMTLGLAPCTANIYGQNVCNVVVVQRVVNAALGQTCITSAP